MTTTERLAPLAAAKAAYLAVATSTFRDLFVELCAAVPALHSVHIKTGLVDDYDGEGMMIERWEYNMVPTNVKGEPLTYGQIWNTELWGQLSSAASELAFEYDVRFTRDELAEKPVAL